jgi:hypothetical protein
MGVSSFQNCDSAYFVMTCIEFRQGCLQVPYDIRRPFFAMHDAISQNTCVGESAFILGLQTFYMRLDISLESLVNPSLFTLPRPLLWAQFPPVQNDYCIEKADILKDMCAFIHSSSVWPIVGGRQNCYSFCLQFSHCSVPLSCLGLRHIVINCVIFVQMDTRLCFIS